VDAQGSKIFPKNSQASVIDIKERQCKEKAADFAATPIFLADQAIKVHCSPKGPQRSRRGGEQIYNESVSFSCQKIREFPGFFRDLRNIRLPVASNLKERAHGLVRPEAVDPATRAGPL
jgi:hypothetical protein